MAVRAVVVLNISANIVTKYPFTTRTSHAIGMLAPVLTALVVLVNVVDDAAVPPNMVACA